MKISNRKAPSSSLLSALMLLVAQSLTASASSSECLRSRAHELSAAAACGNSDLMEHCIASDIPTLLEESALLVELERCIHSAGCTSAETSTEALWMLRRCQRNDDLRKRLGQPVGRAVEGVMPIARMQHMAITARADATSTTAAVAVTTGPTQCYTETMVTGTTCQIETTGVSSGKLIGCFETTLPSSVCADGLICRTDGNGSPTCMYAQNGVGIAGTIIAIIFASVITLSAGCMMFFCCRERSSQKRLAKAAEAASIANEAKNAALVAAKRPGAGVRAMSSNASDRQPLIPGSNGVPALPPQPTYHIPSDEVRENPFIDHHAMK